MLKTENKSFRNIISCMMLLLAMNLVTNYRTFFRFFYTGGERYFKAAEYAAEDHFYHVGDIGEYVNVIQLTYTDRPMYVSVSYTSEDFRKFDHFNPFYYTDRTGTDTTFIFMSSPVPVKDILINISNGSLDKVILNPRVPYHLNGRKTLAYFLTALGLIFVLKGKEKLDGSKKQLAKGAVMITLLSAMSFNMSKGYSEPEMDALYTKYFTDALISHRLELDYPVDAKLKASPDPYDTSIRDYDTLWDATYYNGHYYSYFGILPAAAVLVPYRLMTGQYLSSTCPTLLYTVLCFIAGYLLLKRICRKHLAGIPYRLFALCYLYIVFGSKLIWCIHRPLFYELVAVSALFHVLAGLYLSLFYENRILNFIGYFLLALAVLCRPTFLFASVLIVPKLFEKLKEKRFGIMDLIALAVPYGVVGLFTMYLNYVRFGSVTEFGITYQITANSLRHAGFSFLKAAAGTFSYMFEGFHLQLLPLRAEGIKSYIPIVTDFFTETVGGGFMMTSLIGIFMPFMLRYLRKKEIRKYIYTALGLALALLMLATGIGALVGRYMLDFNYLLYFVTAYVFLVRINEEGGDVLTGIFVTAVSLSIVLNYLLALSYV
ncbi:MAG: hypothetical protein K6F23_10820 [Solobacterium sp.]|nr:hypothetical protein [Solobacterium sp.]